MYVIRIMYGYSLNIKPENKEISGDSQIFILRDCYDNNYFFHNIYEKSNQMQCSFTFDSSVFFKHCPGFVV